MPRLCLSLLVAVASCAAMSALCAVPSLATAPSASLSSSASASPPSAAASPVSLTSSLHSLSLSAVWSSLPSLSSLLSFASSSSHSPRPPLTQSALAQSSAAAFEYSTAAAAPLYLPAARLRCNLQVVDGNSHRSVLMQLGSPVQTLRLLLDTGSSDLLALNQSYCTRSPSASRSCFNPAASSSSSPTVVSSAPFSLPSYVDDGELLGDSSAHAALARANLPVQLVGSNLSLLLGATDVTMQDALLGFPTAASRSVGFVLSSPQTVFVPPIPYAAFPYSVSAVNSLTDVDGLLGLAYAPLSALAQLGQSDYYSSAFLAITQATQTQSQSATFALDFSDNVAHIGGIDERYRDSLQWSYGASFGLDEYHSFSLWDLSVCGANLQRGVLQGTAPLSAIVDTGSACLGLPAELFDALVSWLPVTCSDATDGSQQGQSSATAIDPSLLGGNTGDPVSSPGSSSTYTANPASAGNLNPHVRYCWLAADLLSGALPTVSFRMAQSNPALADDDPQQPPKLFIPLADLILGTPRTSPTSAVEPQSHQVAFSNVAGVSSSNATCVSAVRCVGQQSLDSTYNVCVDPSCSSYYFFELDRSSHRCELTSGFHVLAALLIAALLLSELGLTEWLIRISRRVQGINADDKQTHSAQQARRRRRAAAAAH